MGIQGRFVRRMRKVYGVEVVTRPQWGSRYGPVYRRRLLTHRAKRTVDTVIQHITVTFDTGELIGDFKKDMQTVERIGWERFGSGISYNLLVDPTTGTLGMGMPFNAKGTHTVNDKNVPGYSYDQNYWAKAIALLGMPGVELSPKGRKTVVSALACMMDLGITTEDPDYDPHSKFAAKDCPTDAIRPQMPSILRDAQEMHRTMRRRKREADRQEASAVHNLRRRRGAGKAAEK